jgi:hypothetical protein
MVDVIFHPKLTKKMHYYSLGFKIVTTRGRISTANYATTVKHQKTNGLTRQNWQTQRNINVIQCIWNRLDG